MPTIATRQAAKFWVGLAGACATAVAGTTDLPWLTAVAVALTAAGVYLVPNASAE